MPITIAFTITGLVALITHAVYLRRVILNRKAQRDVGIDGDRERIASAFVYMEWARFGINFCFVTSGIGILAGARPLGYLLALPPLLSILASSFALRGIR